MKIITLKAAAALCAAAGFLQPVRAEVPDSVYVYLYANSTDNHHGGLHWAWSADKEHWISEFPDVSLVKSDYGTWGSQKMMFSPFTLRGEDGLWHVLWSVNNTDPTFAVATSSNLIDWQPQVYPAAGMPGENCWNPEAAYDPSTKSYRVVWQHVAEGDTVCAGCFTGDFHKFTSWRTVPCNFRSDSRVTIPQVNPASSGTICRISRGELRLLRANAKAQAYDADRYRETYRDDSRKFASLKPLKGALIHNGGEPVNMSENLIGIFFEDISRAADGGLYAELVQNRDFEYNPHDLKGRRGEWNSLYAWSSIGNGITISIDSVAPVHKNNRHYAILSADEGAQGALVNSGWEGIPVKKGKKYDFSLFARAKGKSMPLRAELVTPEGKLLASATLKATPGKWNRLTATLIPSATAANALLQVRPMKGGEVDVDMISLFPRDTFHGRRNGLRADLADSIAALKPRFVRFPGGCVAHGDGIHNIYRWKNTIGPLEARVPQRNIWGYHQSAGLGYHEYFEFCEDLGAEPLPVVAAGVPCQNSSDGGAGQQGGVPMEEMEQYVQDILDLVEYANGDARTTRWGAERARNGHAAPFNLRYLGIGNEDLITDVFEERFAMIYRAVREKYPEIQIVGTAGPFHEGSDYDEGWRFAAELSVPFVDEHYYESPAWFIYNNDFYDGYDRQRGKVYLGEYASRGNELFNALAEAAYLTGVERNSDVVAMTSYAPLLAREGMTNWNPDLIYFTGTEVHPTVNYHVQRLYGENSGAKWLPYEIATEQKTDAAVGARIAASVTERADGRKIVKLVNILPVEMEITLPAEDGFSGEATLTTLAGEPSSRNVVPQVEHHSVERGAPLRLAPYSFTVVAFD